MMVMVATITIMIMKLMMMHMSLESFWNHVGIILITAATNKTRVRYGEGGSGCVWQ